MAGDSFDYALNDDVLHLCMIDAMGHGLDAAVMATLAIGAYRHARRIDVELADLYAAMDFAGSSYLRWGHEIRGSLSPPPIRSMRRR